MYFVPEESREKAVHPRQNGSLFREYYYGEYLGIRRYNQALGVSRYQYLKECTRDLTKQYGIERHMEGCYKLRIHTLDRLQNKGRKMIR